MRSIIILLIGIAVLSFLINGIANWLDIQSTASDRKFEVVDTYGGCDVVRYIPGYSANYTYLLHCNK